MREVLEPESVRSLAVVGRDETVAIGYILFDVLRSRCAELGLREGDVVSCRSATPTHIFLERPDGHAITMKRDWARFIQVRAARARGAGPRPAPRAQQPAGEAAELET